MNTAARREKRKLVDNEDQRRVKRTSLHGEGSVEDMHEDGVESDQGTDDVGRPSVRLQHHFSTQTNSTTGDNL